MWEAPDYPGWSKEEFKELFPHDAYANEDDPKHWEKGELVKEMDFDTGKSKKISLGDLKNWKSGKYIVELEAKDKFGQTVTDTTIATIFSKHDKKQIEKATNREKEDKNR